MPRASGSQKAERLPAKPNWHSPSNFHTVWSGVCVRLPRPEDCPSARWSAGHCSRCCREGEGVGEPKPIRQRSLQLEYRFDRLSPDKLAHVYQLLVPDRRQAIGGECPKPANTTTGVNDEQASSHLCASVLGSPEGESHHRQPNGGADRIRAEERIQRAAGMGIPGRRL